MRDNHVGIRSACHRRTALNYRPLKEIPRTCEQHGFLVDPIDPALFMTVRGSTGASPRRLLCLARSTMEESHMADARIRVSQLSFSWPDGTPVLDSLSFVLGASRTGLVAPNGAGKSTLLKLLAGQLQPQAGRIDVQGALAYLPQHAGLHAHASVADVLGVAERLRVLDSVLAGEASAADLDVIEGDWDLRERMTTLLARFGLGGLSLQRRLSTFSGGEAMSLALAAKLLQRPDVLLLDEPTNHLDRQARQRLREVLGGWHGGLLVASHDRELLEGMDQIAVLKPSSLRVYGGGFGFYRQAVEEEQRSAEQRVRQLRSEVHRERRDRQQARERADHRAGAASRRFADGGMPRIAAGNRKRSAQVSAGKADEVHAGRLAEAFQQLREASQALEEAVDMDFTLPATRVAGDRVIFHGERMRVSLDGRALFAADGVSLTIRGPERIALIGGNGVGKTTLLRILAGQQELDEGTMRRASIRIASLTQRLDLLDPERTVAENFADIAPNRPALERAQLLARLQFRGTRQDLPVGVLSGGERLRATLLCILHAEAAPQLLLLDEPTNNLDLASVAHLERTLNAYEGALIVVSHDEFFLDALGLTRKLQLSEGVLREVR